MVVIECCGGIGNQMFQYALYLKLKSLGKDVTFDSDSYTSNSVAHFELDKFGLEYDKPRIWDIVKYRTPVSKLVRDKSFQIYDEKLSVGYQPEIYEIENGCLRGYWQCEKYFEGIEEKVRKSFVFPDNNDAEFQKIMMKIQNTNSTSVHIRRGDYLIPENARKYSGICTMEYYVAAMNYIRDMFPDTTFFFFSDDIEWVRNNLYRDGDDVVDCNHGENSFFDIFLMSQCKNNIIANSSFSWWGAWLNSRNDKVVVSPRRWFKHLDVADAICDSWIKV